MPIKKTTGTELSMLSLSKNENLGYKSKVTPKQHFVYKWTNAITGEYYIGKHSGTEDDGYIGSGKLFGYKYHSAPDQWTREILHYAPSSKAALYAEKNFIGDLYSTDPLCLNLVPGGANDRKMREHDAKHLISEKTEKLSKVTLADWLGVKVFFQFVYSGKNANGHYKMIDTTPQSLRHFLAYLNKTQTSHYDRTVLEKFFVLKHVSLELIPNYAELIESKEEYDMLRQFIEQFAEIVSEYKEKFYEKENIE